jgi:hypothetical protein
MCESLCNCEAVSIEFFAQGRYFMRTMITGFSGWVKMQQTRNESIRTVDTALTVVGTLLVAVTIVLLRS